MTESAGGDERVRAAEAGAVARAEAQLAVTEHSVRYLWAGQLVPGRDVLDAGCGDGRGSGMLADAGARHVVGVDSSADLIGQAEAAIGGPTDFVLADLTDLPFKDASFEVVVCFDVVDHAPAASVIVGELRRVLRPDGHLLVSLAQPPTTDASVAAQPGTPDASVAAQTGTSGLDRLLGEHFAEVGRYTQHRLLGSLVRPIDGPDGAADGRVNTLTRRLARDVAADTRLLVVASVASPPTLLDPTAVVASLAGLRRSTRRAPDAPSQLADAHAADRPAAAALDAGSPDPLGPNARIAALTRRLADAEADNARIPELQGYLDACEHELRKFHSSLLGRIGKAIFHLRSALR